MPLRTSSQPHQRRLLIGLLLAVTVHAFHAMAVVTVVPLVTESLGARAEYGAIFAVYMLAALLGLVAAGRSVDRRGPAPPFAWGSLLFATGLIGSGNATSIEMLLVSRALEGVGGGVISNVLYAAVQRAYTDAERPRVLAWMSGAWVLPGIAGPPLAGVVAEVWGWRWVFLGALPFLTLATVLALPALRTLAPPESARRAAPSARAAVGLVLGVGTLLYALARPLDAIGVVVGSAGAALAVAAARRILPTGTMSARRGLPGAVAGLGVLNFVFFGTEVFVPLALVDVRAVATWQAGAVLTCGALAWTVGAFAQARLDAGRTRRPWITRSRLAGAGWCALGVGVLALTAVLNPDVPVWIAGLAWCVAGAGMGMTYTTLRVAAMAASPVGSEGSTATALGIADTLGFSLAAGLGGAVVAHGEAANQSSATPIAVIWVSAAMTAALGLWLSGRLGPSGRGHADVSKSPAVGRHEQPLVPAVPDLPPGA